MIYFIDTNYLLRLLLKDNQKQHDKVYSLFSQAIHDENIKLITSSLVIFEIEWVLASVYEMQKSLRIRYLKTLLSLDVLRIPEKDLLLASLSLYEKYRISLEDCYFIAFAKNNAIKPEHFGTFDKKLKKIYTTYCEDK